MKIILIIFQFTLIVIITSCETTKGLITGNLTSHTQCKNSNSAEIQAQLISEKRESTPDSLSCVEYSYDVLNEKLTIIHRNAGFNCCPGKLSASIKTENKTITILEQESNSLCDCNCLYDLTFELTNVIPGNYILKFEEPYSGNMQKLTSEIDLTKQTNGSFCVQRKSYPWNLF